MDSLEFSRPKIGRQAAKLTLGIWASTFVLFLLPQLVATGRIPDFLVGAVVIEILVGILISAALYWAAARLQQTTNFLKIAGVAAAVCAAALTFSLFDAWLGGEILRLFMSAHRVPEDVINMTVSNFISFSWLYGMLGSIYVILQTNAAMRERDLQLVQARSLAQAAQLTALRLQLNPHFLFNTLNAISSLIVSGRNRQGEQMLSKLSDFLRTALVSDESGTTTLGEELETLQTYLEIEAVRFRDRLTVEFACPDELLETAVPNFILQPLVENAVKHGVAPTSGPVIIRVAARRDGDDLVMTVTNNASGTGQAARSSDLPAEASAGVGLANTRRRLEVIYGTRARVETMQLDDGFLALVRLPLTNKASVALVA